MRLTGNEIAILGICAFGFIMIGITSVDTINENFRLKTQLYDKSGFGKSLDDITIGSVSYISDVTVNISEPLDGLTRKFSEIGVHQTLVVITSIDTIQFIPVYNRYKHEYGYVMLSYNTNDPIAYLYKEQVSNMLEYLQDFPASDPKYVGYHYRGLIIEKIYE